MVHTFEYYDPDNKVSLKGNTKIILVELQKLREVTNDKIEKMTPKELWATFFKYAERPDKREVVNKVIGSERWISMAAQTLRSISQNEVIALQAMSEEKRLTDYVRDLNSAKDYARKEGRAEGERIGRDKFKNQMIERMRSEGFTEEQIRLICEA